MIKKFLKKINFTLIKRDIVQSNLEEISLNDSFKASTSPELISSPKPKM